MDDSSAVMFVFWLLLNIPTSVLVIKIFKFKIVTSVFCNTLVFALFMTVIKGFMFGKFYGFPSYVESVGYGILLSVIVTPIVYKEYHRKKIKG